MVRNNYYFYGNKIKRFDIDSINKRKIKNIALITDINFIINSTKIKQKYCITYSFQQLRWLHFCHSFRLQGLYLVFSLFEFGLKEMIYSLCVKVLVKRFTLILLSSEDFFVYECVL